MDIEEAIEKAKQGADPKWLEEAYAHLVYVAKAKDYFIVDDVWTSLSGTRENRAMGPVIARGLREGTMVATGVTVAPPNTKRQRQRRKQYRSLLRSVVPKTCGTCGHSL